MFRRTGILKLRALVGLVIAGMAVTMMCAMPPAAHASGGPVGTISNFGDDGLMGALSDIVTGQDGNLWFRNPSSPSSIGRSTPTGVVTLFSGANVSGTFSLIAGPDGNLWYLNSSPPGIARMTTAGVATAIVSPDIVDPRRIAIGPDGNVWALQPGSLLKITSAGMVTKVSTSAAITFPSGATAASDGNLWVIDSEASPTLKKVTGAGVVTTIGSAFPGLQRLGGSITSGPDGNLWFTGRCNSSSSSSCGEIGRSTTGGVVTNYSGASYPQGIVAGPDGNLWFTNGGNGLGPQSIGRITPAGAMSLFTGRGLNSPAGITSGPQGRLWFTNYKSIGSSSVAGVIDNHTAVVEPFGITNAADGNVWFVDRETASVGRVSPTGHISKFGAPAVGLYMDGIGRGPDGDAWVQAYRLVPDPNNTLYTMQVGSIIHVSPSGAMTEYADPGMGAIEGIAPGPDGNVWFTTVRYSGGAHHAVGRMTPTGNVTYFTDATTAQGFLTGITLGPDGAMWFTNVNGGSISRITMSGAITHFTDPAFSRPDSVVTGPDGNMWFVNKPDGQPPSIGRMTVAGVVTMFNDAGIVAPYSLTVGPDSNLWFVNYDYSSGSIGRITPAGAVTTFTNATVQGPWSITSGSDGGMWFANRYGSSIGRITALSAAPTTPAAPTGALGVAHNQSVQVSWSAPLSDGGSAITGYTVTASPGGKSCSWTSGPLSCVVTGLTNGQAYTFTVTATNAVGVGPASAASAAVTPAGPPGVPTGVVGVAGNAQVAVSWTAPASSGGAVITGYVVTASPGGKTCSWSSGPLSCTVAGLTNGQAYTFAVTATNSAGSGAASAPSAPVTPAGLPGAPSAVVAVPSSGQAVVSWVAPGSTGGAPMTGYAVTSSPGGKTCVWVSGPLTCTVTGLSNGTAYTFAVTATNSAGVGPASSASAAVTPVSGSYFHPLAPTRILDSRGPNGGWNAKLAAGAPKVLTVTGGASSVPANVDAVVINVTATGSSSGSFLTVYPAGASVPGTSSLNFGAGETIPNLVTVKVGTNGQVAFANAVGTVDVIVDIVGYFDAVPADRYNAVAPARILDSRGPNGGWNAKLTAGAPKNLQVRGAGGVPATADAVIMNVTATGGSANSFLTVYPAGGAVPTASNVNFAAGQTIPNLVTVKIGANGQVGFANAVGGVDVIADVVGYFDATTGDVFHAITPARALDSRGSTGGWNAKLTAGVPRNLTVTGVGGVPANATAVFGNTTVTGGTANSFVTVYPAGQGVPNASNVNFAAGQTIPNMVAVKIGTNGQIGFANAVGAVDVIFDTTGYYTTN